MAVESSRGPAERASDTRRRILDAALACFIESGYEQTTIARIRERSGASNGALFHYFASKEAIADALHVDAIMSFQVGLWDLLRRKPRSLRAAVRGSIAHQLRWIEENEDRARFLYERGHLDWDSPAGAQLVELNRNLAHAYRDWMAPLLDSGQIRPMSMLMMTAIVTGPVHAIAQRWLGGQLGSPLHVYLDELVDAACAALSATPASSRSRPRSLARHGRIRLELVTDDGSVVADGEATAELPARARWDAGVSADAGIEQVGEVSVLRLSAAEGRFNPLTLGAIAAVVDELEGSDAPGALVITGEGKFFSNGLDLDWMSSAPPAGAAEVLDGVHALLAQLLVFPIATVAAINGHAFAAGAMLALACDLRVMREDRGYFCLPEVDLGLAFTPGMTALLKARLSPATAHEAMVTGRRYSAPEALAVGIVEEVAPSEQVLETAVGRAAALVGRPRATVAAIKRGLYADAAGALAPK